MLRGKHVGHVPEFSRIPQLLLGSFLAVVLDPPVLWGRMVSWCCSVGFLV